LSRYWVYILRCSDGSLYTGYTVDLERRVSSHESGRGSKYTRSRLPVSLAYSEGASTLRRALRRESEIKKLSRSAKLLLCSDYRGDRRESSR
jgi:putative endonuclease